MSNDEKVKRLVNEVSELVGDPTKGLPEELFLLATEITPMVNVDLLIHNDKKQILLAWRDDYFYGKGWHVPGGIIRLKESFEERIKKVGEIEIGCPEIMYNPEPLEIVPIICPEMKRRGHFITFVYECYLPDGFEIENKVGAMQAGYLKWHDTFPDDMLDVHAFYKKYWG